VEKVLSKLENRTDQCSARLDSSSSPIGFPAIDNIDNRFLMQFNTRVIQQKDVIKYLRTDAAVSSRPDLVAWLENEYIELRAGLLEAQASLLENLDRMSVSLQEFFSEDGMTRCDSREILNGKESLIEWRKNREAAARYTEEQQEVMKAEGRKNEKAWRKQQKLRQALIRETRGKQRMEERQALEAEKLAKAREKNDRMRLFSKIEERISRRSEGYLLKRGSWSMKKKEVKKEEEEGERSENERIAKTKILLRRFKSVQ
jgi:hypothetical protein